MYTSVSLLPARLGHRFGHLDRARHLAIAISIQDSPLKVPMPAVVQMHHLNSKAIRSLELPIRFQHASSRCQVARNPSTPPKGHAGHSGSQAR